MATQFELKAEERTLLGKNSVGRLRRTGLIPAVIYGQGKKALSVSIDPKTISEILRSESGHNTIFRVIVGKGDPLNVMIKDYQLDPVRGKFLHADLLTIAMDRKMKFRVPVEIVGEPSGVKNSGGVLDIIRREIEVECLPSDVPDHIPVNVEHLEINDHLRIAEVEYDKTKFQILEDPDQTVLTVLPPRAEEVAAPAVPEEGAAAEPEVIKKGKVEEPGEAEGAEAEKPREKEKK
ncbi:MAG: 50S ribosomal protein L25 [Acidobacteria bacterium]|nr:50S ribosomal protein L25 [Acidobacteriota bacterium]